MHIYIINVFLVMYGFYSSQFASGGTSFQLTNKQTIKYIKNDINYNTKIYLLKFCSLQTLRSLKMMKLLGKIPKIKKLDSQSTVRRVIVEIVSSKLLALFKTLVTQSYFRFRCKLRNN